MVYTYANETSASFQIPERLRNNSNMQVIWSKGRDTPCVFHLGELISQCACNEYSHTNFITIFDGTLFITNLSQKVSLYFVNSASTGNRNLRSLEGVVTLQGI